MGTSSKPGLSFRPLATRRAVGTYRLFTQITVVVASTALAAGCGSGKKGTLAVPTPLTPTPLSTPAPTPSPTSVPKPALSARYFPIAPNSNLVYAETFGQFDGSSTSDTTTGYSFIYGADGFGLSLGKTTQFFLNGIPVSETMVTNGFPLFVYYTTNSDGLSHYGDDDFYLGDTYTFRYTPALVFPFNLTQGQTVTQTVQYTDIDTTKAKTYANDLYTRSITFNDFETIAVPAGTFDVARITETDTTVDPTSDLSGAETVIITKTFFVAQDLGMVKEHSVTVITSAATSSAPAATSSKTDDYVLTSTTGVGASAETRYEPANNGIVPKRNFPAHGGNKAQARKRLSY